MRMLLTLVLGIFLIDFAFSWRKTEPYSKTGIVTKERPEKNEKIF